MRRTIVTLAILASVFLSACSPATVSRYDVRDWFQRRGATVECCQDGSQAHVLAIKLRERYYLLVYLSRLAPNGARWDRVAACESGGRWNLSTGNGYYGGLQFTLGTWQAYGGTGYPHQNSREAQIRVAERVRIARGGLGDWPVCGARW